MSSTILPINNALERGEHGRVPTCCPAQTGDNRAPLEDLSPSFGGNEHLRDIAPTSLPRVREMFQRYKVALRKKGRPCVESNFVTLKIFTSQRSQTQ